MNQPGGRADPLAVDHVSFAVTDVAAAVDFYVDVLGCEEIPRPDLGFAGAWLRLGGGTELHLVEPLAGIDVGTPPAEPTGNANHVAFAVSSHEDTLARLRARGYDVREGTVGIRQLFVQDPSGNVIELIERPPEGGPRTGDGTRPTESQGEA